MLRSRPIDFISQACTSHSPIAIERQPHSMSSTTTMTSQPAAALYTRIEASYAFRADNKIDPALRERIAVSLGYAAKDAEKIPEAANIGEGCGNPLSIACLKEVSTSASPGPDIY